MALIKEDLAGSIFQQFDFTRAQSVQVVESILDIIKQTLGNGEEILISGFGKFYINEKRKQRGRNPKTGDDLMLRPRKVVKFRPSGGLRDRMNGKNNIPLSEKLS
ncbi:MAG: integration host factor subunit alpha [Thermodesulfobacteriota bacterium]|nr:integration host factor subunit alpha [Thermodesulfobacteriota bacterium]